ncbi:MAG: YicC/YloC family endoribonuclease [Candidatus Omnitrophota bacterium]
MIYGMTGFGRQNFTYKKTRGFVEIRSLNHKHFDIAFHIPAGFGIFEERLKRLLHKEISRGKLNVSLVFTSRPDDKIYVREEVARNYLKTFKVLNKSLHLKNDLGLSSVITLPGVIRSAETELSAEEIWPAVEKAAKQALENLLRLRKREGEVLYRDIVDKLHDIEAVLKLLPRRVKDIAQGKRKMLSDEEFSSFLRATDINEELIRFGHHVKSFKDKLGDGKGAGKELDFIAQELQREINTIGAKCMDKVIAECVIKIKSQVEKIREQLQNLE